jgi:hypothetical protein
MSTAVGGSFRNRIINGDMRIDQRNAGASVNPANADVTLDRWGSNMFPNASKYTVVQSTTAPVGFNSSLLVTSSSSYSVSPNDIYTQFQWIEGFNTADLGWGTVNAKTVTVSFWVRSSLTGTFGGALSNSDQTRTYPFTYTINSANIFEKKTITIAGDTSGTWLTTNGRGIAVVFGLGVGTTLSGTAGAWAAGYYSATGAVSVVGTSGATWYVTGVQLEAGSTATEFERRPIGTELALCQRYFLIYEFGVDETRCGAHFLNGNTQATSLSFPVTMRSSPTASFNTTTGSFWNLTANAPLNTAVSGFNTTKSSFRIGTTGNPGSINPAMLVLSGSPTLSAEL